jgi:hypothetical protein
VGLDGILQLQAGGRLMCIKLRWGVLACSATGWEILQVPAAPGELIDSLIRINWRYSGKRKFVFVRGADTRISSINEGG